VVVDVRTVEKPERSQRGKPVEETKIRQPGDVEAKVTQVRYRGQRGKPDARRPAPERSKNSRVYGAPARSPGVRPYTRSSTGSRALPETIHNPFHPNA
jgi:hypothetical protein